MNTSLPVLAENLRQQKFTAFVRKHLEGLLVTCLLVHLLGLLQHYLGAGFF